jgi:hypothetical protein
MCCIFKNYHAFKYKNKRWGTVRNYNGNGKKKHNFNSIMKIAFLSPDRSVPTLSNTVPVFERIRAGRSRSRDKNVIFPVLVEIKSKNKVTILTKQIIKL